MDGFQTTDPYNSFIEEVYLGRYLVICSEAKVIYDSRTGGTLVSIIVSLCIRLQIYLDLNWILLDFTAEVGQIIGKTQERTQSGTSTTITVRSNLGYSFVFTRYPGGGLYGLLTHYFSPELER